MRPAVLLLLLFAAAGGLSCGDTAGPRPPTPGTLLLNLTTPHADDAALLIHLTGPALAPTAVAAATADNLLYAREASGGGVTVAVFGSVRAGPLLRIVVPDVDRAGEYRMTVVEVADATNALRAAVSGYSGRFVRD